MIKKGEKLRKIAGKKPKLSLKELEAKQLKKEFNMQANYFKFLKKVGNVAVKDFKKAKKELKKGNQAKAKELIAKYTLMNINAWVKVTEK